MRAAQIPRTLPQHTRPMRVFIWFIGSPTSFAREIFNKDEMLCFPTVIKEKPCYSIVCKWCYAGIRRRLCHRLLLRMLKKATSGVLAILSCSRRPCTLRASKRLRPSHSATLMAGLDEPLRKDSGHAFLTIPLAADVDRTSGMYGLCE
jgi:hypothetical protein